MAFSSEKGRDVGRYPIGGFRIGRVAISRAKQGRGLGGQLLVSAAERCIQAAHEVRGQVLVIDAKYEASGRRFGALRLLDAPLTFVMPFALFAEALVRSGRKGRGKRLI